MNIAICFCVRNCGAYLPDIFNNIERVRTLNVNVFSIFVYDNCTDNSEQLLKEYYEKNKEYTVLRHIENYSEHRTVRIAKARNTCLDIVYHELNNISFHIMADCDDIGAPPWNIDIINKYLHHTDNDDWDCISFNRTDYYDIWALLFDDIKHHCWGFGQQSPLVVHAMREMIMNKLSTCTTNSIEVLSAFNGFCIYNTERFKGFYYDGFYSNFKHLITDTELYYTVKAFQRFNLHVDLYETIECCEHLFYHVSAYQKGRKIKISKYMII